jgi:hypothetical protein
MQVIIKKDEVKEDIFSLFTETVDMVDFMIQMI